MTARVSILVVDDTAENLRLLGTVLRENGYEARPVPNGKLALQAVTIDPPDLILMDINMPDMNGIDVCEELKMDERTMDIPVIFVSALGEPFDKVRAFSVGGVDYITKPFQFEEVLARVRTHLILRRTQRELEERIKRQRELEALRDSLVQMIVHDVRSPVWAIESLAGRLAKESLAHGRPEFADRLEMLRGAASRLGRMVANVLDVSRIESNAMPLQLADTELRPVVQAAIDSVALGEHGRPIELQVEPGLRATCDANVVRRVVENLVGNGLRYTSTGTALHIDAGSRPGFVRIQVRDHGPGIPPEDREHIFEKYGTVESRRHHAGSGLGLAFCRLAVEAHGGTIGVDPADGGGSRFWFELPALGPGT